MIDGIYQDHFTKLSKHLKGGIVDGYAYLFIWDAPVPYILKEEL